MRPARGRRRNIASQGLKEEYEILNNAVRQQLTRASYGIAKEAKRLQNLSKSNFARCFVAVQKGHMIEQVINKRNQRVCREIHS